MHLNSLENCSESFTMQINLGIDDLLLPPHPTQPNEASAMQEHRILRLALKGKN
jgi:hypothetical protein